MWSQGLLSRGWYICLVVVRTHPVLHVWLFWGSTISWQALHLYVLANNCLVPAKTADHVYSLESSFFFYSSGLAFTSSFLFLLLRCVGSILLIVEAFLKTAVFCRWKRVSDKCWDWTRPCCFWMLASSKELKTSVITVDCLFFGKTHIFTPVIHQYQLH